MLVLSRRENETVLLGHDVQITILGIEGDRVRIGIEAPKSMRIIRQELIVQTKDMNKEAANTPQFTLREE